ncbi:hypothetical protein FRC02_005531 [Tulasnella sp. 418]|nr:hypothetical protein FRC02_005531 [Tulasnella sp. 418]
MADITKSNEFLKGFHDERDRIKSQLNTSNSPSAKELQSIGGAIAQLSSSLQASVSFLTSYDQRLCDQDLKTLQEELEKRRQLLPKSRFAFKKKAAASGDPQPSPSPKPDSPNLTTPAENAPAESSADIRTSNVLIDKQSKCFISSGTLALPSTASDITISNLDHCVVELKSAAVRPTALYIRSLRHTVVIAGMVNGSVRIEDCQGCVFVTGSHQFRVEHCQTCDVYCYVSSIPVIEDSKGMRFAPYPEEIPSNLSDPIKPSQHHLVKDFSWIRTTPSPNWVTLPEEERANWKNSLEQLKAVADIGSGASTLVDTIKELFPITDVKIGP